MNLFPYFKRYGISYNELDLEGVGGIYIRVILISHCISCSIYIKRDLVWWDPRLSRIIGFLDNMNVNKVWKLRLIIDGGNIPISLFLQKQKLNKFIKSLFIHFIYVNHLHITAAAQLALDLFIPSFFCFFTFVAPFLHLKTKIKDEI